MYIQGDFFIIGQGISQTYKSFFLHFLSNTNILLLTG